MTAPGAPMRTGRLVTTLAAAGVLAILVGLTQPAWAAFTPGSRPAIVTAAPLRAVPPGVIVFSREDSGSTDPTKQYDNLKWMDAQNPNQPPVGITSFAGPGTVADTPI